MKKESSIFDSKCRFYFHVDVFDGRDLVTYVEFSYTEGQIECSKTMVIEKSKEVGSIRSFIYYVIIIDYILRSKLQRCDG